MDNLDKEIVRLLRRHKELSTYEIAKRVKVSWSTVYTRLLKLALNGIIEMKKYEEFPTLRTIYWKIKK